MQKRLLYLALEKGNPKQDHFFNEQMLVFCTKCQIKKLIFIVWTLDIVSFLIKVSSGNCRQWVFKGKIENSSTIGLAWIINRISATIFFLQTWEIRILNITQTILQVRLCFLLVYYTACNWSQFMKRYKKISCYCVLVAQWLAWGFATREVLVLNPVKIDNY